MKKVTKLQTKYGLSISDYEALISSSRKIRISKEEINSLLSKYPKLPAKEAMEILQILRSPCRNTFTAYDIISYIKSL